VPDVLTGGTLSDMLRLRILSPTHKTDEALRILDEEPGVSGLAVLRGAAVRPVGDVIEADLAREVANDVIEKLRATGLHHCGSIELDPVHAWLSRDGFDAELSSPGSSADTVVWAEVAQRSYEDVELNWTYLSFMTMATLLAGIAIITDSQILTIGAMVLGPEFGAIAALGVALVKHRYVLLGAAVRTLVVGFAVAIAATTVAALTARVFGWVTFADVTGPRPDTAFIYAPDKWSFVVAIIAAAAGVLSLTSSKLGGLSGVFISVTTVPAAGNVGVGLAFGAWDEVWGSTQQLLLNIFGMALAGWATLAIQQKVWSRVSVRRARLLDRRRRML
jgi:uncharacterized hydrophobic protein (TIGR00271 family)